MRYKHFSKTERLELSILLKKGYSLRSIADVLGRNPSSVSRELKRNKVCGEYDALKAHHKAYVKRKYSKYQGMKIREHPELEQYLKDKLPLGWSPEKIAGRWNNIEGKNEIAITAKGIYKYLYSNYGQYYCQYLKSMRYRKKRRKRNKSIKEIIKNRIFIDKRPMIIDSRLRYGDFEADTMGRPKHASSQTLAVVRERKSRYIMAKKVRRLKYSMNGFKELFNDIPVKTVTFDNGVENTRHQELGVKTYFCNPYHSWEKGSVENSISLIREYIPKGSDLADYSDDFISAIVNRINNTPMKCLKFRTPKEIFEGRFLKITYPQCCT